MLRVLLVGAGASFSTKDVEDGYLQALRTLAGVDVKFYSLEARLQLAHTWLKQLWRARGKPPDQRPTWPDTVYRASIEAFEMALRYDVDWVVVISGMYFHPDVLGLLRRGRVRTSVLLTESPYEDEAQARVAALVDVVWTTERTSVEPLRLACRHVHYLRHAHDPARHHLSVPDVGIPAHDVVFVGTGFEERIALLDGIDWSGIDLGLYGTWSLLGSRAKLRAFVRGGPITNDSAVELYRRARVGLNLHRTSQSYGRGVAHVAGAESLNPRTYELAACGVFQLSQYRPEVLETFGPSVPTFETAEDLERLVRHALAQHERSADLSLLARELVAPHTYAARAAQLVADLEGFDDRALMAKGA